jgi:hypothetical protein
LVLTKYWDEVKMTHCLVKNLPQMVSLPHLKNIPEIRWLLPSPHPTQTPSVYCNAITLMIGNCNITLQIDLSRTEALLMASSGGATLKQGLPIRHEIV